MACACSFASRPDLPALDAALARWESLRQLEKAHPGASRSALDRHRRVCLGLVRPATLPAWDGPSGALSAEQAAEAKREAADAAKAAGDAVSLVSQVSHGAVPDGARMAVIEVVGPPREVSVPTRGPSVVTPEVIAERRRRVETCAQIVTAGKWSRSIVRGLCADWGVRREAVWGYHRDAVAEIRADRGGHLAQAELSIADCRRERDALLAIAERRRKEADALMKIVVTAEEIDPIDPGMAAAIDRKNAVSLYRQATADASAAHAWHVQLDKIAGVLAPTTAIQINVLSDPAVHAFLDRLVDAFANEPAMLTRLDEACAQISGQAEAPLALAETGGTWGQ